jgi:hypothetical protein
MQNLQIKTSLEKDTTLNFPVWHKNGTREAFLMHVMAVLDAIKKPGHFKDYKKAQKAYVESKQAVELARAGLALLDRTSRGSRKGRKKKAKTKQRKPKQKPKKPRQNPRKLKEHQGAQRPHEGFLPS